MLEYEIEKLGDLDGITDEISDLMAFFAKRVTTHCFPKVFGSLWFEEFGSNQLGLHIVEGFCQSKYCVDGLLCHHAPIYTTIGRLQHVLERVGSCFPPSTNLQIAIRVNAPFKDL